MYAFTVNNFVRTVNWNMLPLKKLTKFFNCVTLKMVFALRKTNFCARIYEGVRALEDARVAEVI